MVLRYARPDDMEAIFRVWNASFGDSEDFIRTFFEKTNILDTTVVAELDGEVCSLMCAFDGICGASYLYALCTNPDYRGRGIGGEVLRESMRLARERGAKAVCLHPADNSLSKWYENNFGMVPAGCFTEELFTPVKTALTAREASFQQLAQADEILTAQLCSAQETLARFYGGKLLQIGNALLYADEREGRVTVKAVVEGEQNNFSEEEIFSSAAKYFSASELVIRRYFEEKPLYRHEHYVNLLFCRNDNDFHIHNSLTGFQYVLD